MSPAILKALRCAAALALLAAAPVAQAQAPGSLDASYNPNVTRPFDGFSTASIRAMAAQPDGRMIIAGLFDMAGGAAHANIARFNADGSIDPSFTASPDSNVNYQIHRAAQ